MRFGWKVLIPVSLVWILVIATIRVWRTHGGSPACTPWPGLLVVALLTLLFLGDAAAQRRAQAAEEAAAQAAVPLGTGVSPGSWARRRPGLPGSADGPAALPRDRGGHVPRGSRPGGIWRVPGHDEGGDRCLSSWAPSRASGSPSGRCSGRSTPSQHPEEKKPTAPRYHGRHQLNRWPDGLQKCIGCELGAGACPADAIYVEGDDNTPEERVISPASAMARLTRSTTCD